MMFIFLPIIVVILLSRWINPDFAKAKSARRGERCNLLQRERLSRRSRKSFVQDYLQGDRRKASSIAISGINRRLDMPVPLSMIISATTTYAGVILATEFLSAMHLLTAVIIKGLWIIACVAALACNRKYPLRAMSSLNQINNLPLSIKSVTGLMVVAVIIPLALTAYSACANTWDSMTYHLPRVEHWIQNKTLDYYPTTIDRQLWKAPGAEIAILHARLLSGNDRWVNMPQWLGLIGSLICSWGILSLWGKSLRAKVLTVVMLSTVPMVMLQSTSTQNDLLAGFWLLAFIYLGLVFLERPSRWALLFSGLALAIAVGTKETNYVFAWPMAGYVVFKTWRHRGWRSAAAVVSILLGVVIVINAGAYMRNWNNTRHVIGGSDYRLVNETFDVSVPVVNIIRYVAYNLSSPIVPMNHAVENAARALTQVMGLNIDDLRTSVDKFSLVTMVLDEDFAPNAVAGILIVIGLAGIWLRPRLNKDHGEVALAFCFSVLTFCWYLKWQPFNNRIMVPLLLWGLVLAGATIGERIKEKTMVVLCSLLVLLALPYVFINANRPLLGPQSILSLHRQTQYYRKQPDGMNTDFITRALLLKTGCPALGVMMGINDWEYPLWAALKIHEPLPIRIEHVFLNKPNVQYPLGDFAPCVLLSTVELNGNQIFYAGNFYQKVFQRQPAQGPEHALWMRINEK